MPSVPHSIRSITGQITTSRSTAQIGPVEAHIFPDNSITENLISPNSFEPSSYEVTLHNNGGAIKNLDTGVVIPLHRKNDLWAMHLRDLMVPRETRRHHSSRYYSLGAHHVPIANSEQSDYDSCYFTHKVPDPNDPQACAEFDRRYNTTRSTSAALHESKSKLKLCGAEALSEYIRLHKNYGHLTVKKTIKSMRGNHPTITDIRLTEGQIRRFAKTYHCPDCDLAKRRKLSFQKNFRSDRDINETSELNSRNALEGQIISCDLVGPINPATASGCIYFYIFVDVVSDYVSVIPSRRKDTDSFLDAFVIVHDEYMDMGKRPRILRTDGGSEIAAMKVERTLRGQYDMTIQHSIPYSQWQNRVERTIQDIVPGSSALLHSQPWLGASHWDLALLHQVMLHNVTACRHDQSPRETLTKKRVDSRTSFKFAFGDFICVDIQEPEHAWRFDLKNEIAIYVGEPKGYKGGHLLFFPKKRTVLVRYHCTKLDISDTDILRYYDRRSDMQKNRIDYDAIEHTIFDYCVGYDPDQEVVRPVPKYTPLFDHDETDLPSIPPRRSQRLHLKTNLSALHTGAADSNQQHPGDSLFTSTAPSKLTVAKALNGQERAQWIIAIRAEIDLLMRQGTLEIADMSNLATNRRVIHSTMQLKRKLRADSTLEKLKARLCACGNELYGSVTETYSPTVSALTYSAVHQLAVIDEMHMCTVDTIGAYLYQSYPCGPGDQAIYMTLPDNVAQVLNMPVGQLYRIRKYLYGLPDSGRAYYEAYSKHLEDNGYHRTVADPCLFVRIQGTSRVFVFIHVDDTFVCATHKRDLEAFANCVKKKFAITINHEVDQYLGIQMTKTERGILLRQPKLLSSIFEEYYTRLTGSKRKRTPQRARATQSHDLTPMERTEYLHLLGALIYLTKSRPDITTAVSFGATHSVHPTQGHFDELIHCVNYLHDTRDQGLLIQKGKGQKDATLRITAYVDASYLTHDDSKSHQGYCITLGQCGSFYTKSQKQQLVATSSTHAELKALYSLTIDLLYLIHLFTELGRPVALPCIALEDNSACIEITKDTSSRLKHCKHYLMLVQFVREQVHSGMIQVMKVPTEQNLADILTKIVTGEDFHTKKDLLLSIARDDQDV